MLKEIGNYVKTLLRRKDEDLAPIMKRARWAPINYVSYIVLYAFSMIFVFPQVELHWITIIGLIICPLIHFVQVLLGHWLMYLPLYLHVPERDSKKWDHILPTAFVEAVILLAIGAPISLLVKFTTGSFAFIAYPVIILSAIVNLLLFVIHIWYYVSWYRFLFSVGILKGILFYFEAIILISAAFFLLAYLYVGI